MKKLFNILFLLCFAITAFAQKASIQQDNRMMSLGSRPSFQVTLPNTDSKTVEKLWKDFVKDKTGGKIKFDKKSKENIALGLSSGITPGTTADLYSTISSSERNVLLTIWLDKGSAFINSKDDAANTTNVESFLTDFAQTVERNTIQNQLNMETEKQAALDKKLARLVKDKDGLHKDIQEWEEKIRKAREAIKENEVNQANTKKEIEVQARATEAVQKALENVGKGQ